MRLITTGAACVARDGDWTVLAVRAPGAIVLSARLSAAALLGDEPPCAVGAAPTRAGAAVAPPT